MNKVILSGNLCRDIEIKQTTGGKMVVTNSIAVKREFKNTNGEYETDFIYFQAWGGQAEYLSKYARKGDRLEICGRWQVREYQAADGSKKTVNECVVDLVNAFSFKGYDRGRANETAQSAAEMPVMTEWQEDGDLPFKEAEQWKRQKRYNR